MFSTSFISNTTFSPSDPDELCKRLELLMQEVQAGNKSNKINVDKIVKLYKLLEYKCRSEKEHKQILIKCSLLHKQV